MLAALVRLDRPTVRAVAAEAGYRSTGNVHRILVELRDAGFVTWVDDARGTLRATFDVAWPDYMLSEP